MRTINDDIDLSNYEGTISSTNGDLNLQECNGVFSTTNGDIELYQCTGSASTTNGDIHITNSKVNEVETTNGDITIVESNIDNIKTANGKVVLKNTNVKEMEANNISGKGTIEHLILKRNTKSSYNTNIFKPSTWFGCTSSNGTSTINIGSNSVNISYDGNINIVNGKVFVNGKEIKEQTENKEEQKWEVPKGIKINKITTDMTIIADYDIEIDGNGKLEKKISLL